MMGCGRRSSRMIFSGLGRYNSKSNPIQEFVSSRRSYYWRSSNLGESTILRKRVKNQQRESPLVDGAKRFYNSSNNQVVHVLKARRGWIPRMWDLETSVVMAFFSYKVALDVYSGSWDTVPYTKRRQLLAHREHLEEASADYFEQVKKSLSGLILPPLHPDSVRVQKIAWNLVEACRRKEGDDDARIKKRWEFFVVNNPFHGTLSSPCGMIGVFRGVVNSSAQDAEIAAFIAPVVGGVMASHAVESSSMVVLLSSLSILILHVFVTSNPFLRHLLRFPLVRSVVYYMAMEGVKMLLRKIYSLKMDLEAEYIGLMLVASAGYDPRVAFQAREKTARIGDASIWQKIKARRLVLDMDEALSIYREVMAGQDV